MWIPKSEDELRHAIESGDLKENAALDVKRSVGDTDGSRAETAKDLASFALNGGALLIGIHEDKPTQTFSLAPQPLAGAGEKLEQIAQTRIDPPLFVRVIDIPSVADPKVGYLFVEVPPSPVAPHMVQSKYVARGDRTTRRMTDAEVVLQHQRRQNEDDRIRAILRDEVDRDPWAGTHGRFEADLILVAEPLRAQRHIMLDSVRSGNTEIVSILADVERMVPPELQQIPPTPMGVGWWPIRARGVAASSFPNGARVHSGEIAEKNALDIEFQEDGGIRVFCGRLSFRAGGNDRSYLNDGLAVAYATRLIHWARTVAAVSGYRGPWGFGIAATKVRGLTSHALSMDIGRTAFPYDRDDYEEVTTATLQEIEDTPGVVVNRVVGQFVRGVGVSHRYDDMLG